MFCQCYLSSVYCVISLLSSLALSVIFRVQQCLVHCNKPVFNLTWQTHPRTNRRFTAHSVALSSLNTPTSSRTPSTPSSLEQSLSPDRLDFDSPFRTSTPPTSPAPQIVLQPPLPTPARRIVMPTNNIDIFHGDGWEGENPQNFLCAFCREMRSLTTTDNKEIAAAFVNYLGASSQADLWF